MKSMNKVTVLSIVSIFAINSLIIKTHFCQAMPNATNGATMISNSATPQQQNVSQPTPKPLAPTDGPNTIDYPEDVIGSNGNWIKKKSWLLNSYKVNNTIQALANDVQATRKDFSDKFVGINEKLDNFYKVLGLEQGKLDQLFNSIEDFLTKKKTRTQAALESDHERALVQQAQINLLNKTITEQRNKLGQLKLDIKSIADLDNSLIDRLKKMDESISSSNATAREAQERIKILWDIIDDKKARIIYYELNGTFLAKITAINTYLKNILLPDFIKVIELIETQIAKTQAAIDGLEKEGLVIQQRTQRVIALKLQKELDKEQALNKEPAKKTTLTVQQPTKWYNTLSATYKIFITTLKKHTLSLYATISTWFFKSVHSFTKKNFQAQPSEPPQKSQNAALPDNQQKNPH